MTRIIYDMSEDIKIRELARLHEKAIHDEASALRKATEEGIAIGEERQRKAMIEKMKAMGMSEEQINAILSLN